MNTTKDKPKAEEHQKGLLFNMIWQRNYPHSGEDREHTIAKFCWSTQVEIPSSFQDFRMTNLQYMVNSFCVLALIPHLFAEEMLATRDPVSLAKPIIRTQFQSMGSKIDAMLELTATFTLTHDINRWLHYSRSHWL